MSQGHFVAKPSPFDRIPPMLHSGCHATQGRIMQRLIKAAENVIAAIVGLFRWWFAQIARQNTLRAKAVVACVGLLALCVVCSVPVALVNGPKKPAAVVASVPSVRPTTVEQAPPMASATTKPTSVSPTDTPLPTSTPEPSTATPEPITKPTAVPTEKPQPTAEPAPPQAIVATDPNAHTFNGKTVDPPWWPCTKGQIKGSQTGKYHVPGGQFYARTYDNVTCFNTAAEAEAAGFVASQR